MEALGARASRPESSEGEDGDEPVLRGRKALVADDDAGARNAIAAALRAMGIDVLETSDGGATLTALTSHYKDGRTPAELDLIVTDIHMPVLDGLEVFRGLRAAHWTTPTIVVTGDDNAHVRKAAELFGAIVLTKPLDLDVLEAVVVRLVAPRPRGRAPLFAH